MNMIEFDKRECVDMERVCHFWGYADDRNQAYSVEFVLFGSDKVNAVKFKTREEAISAYETFKKATNTRTADGL